MTRERRKMNRESRFLPLRAKLAFWFALLAMTAIGMVTLLYYQNTKAQLRQDIRERLQRGTRATHRSIPGG